MKTHSFLRRLVIMAVLSFSAQLGLGQIYSNGFSNISGTNVGVGTNSPSTSFEVKGNLFNGSSNYANPFKVVAKDRIWVTGESSYWQTVEYPAIFVNKSAWIGLKTETPLEEIHLNGVVRGGDVGGVLKLQSDYGYLRFGAFNSSYLHFITDRDQYYFNKKLVVDEGIISAYNDNLQLRTGSSTRLSFDKYDGTAQFFGSGLVFNDENSQPQISFN